MTDWTVWQETDVAQRFLTRRQAGIPGGKLQLETMLRLIDSAGVRAPRVLDLGCGDGPLLEAILSAWPEASGIAFDGSAAMLEAAQARLTGKPVTFIQGDFAVEGWEAALPVHEFEVIVSGFAIHHSEDDIKQRIYQTLFELLAPGGVFVHVEHVAPASPRGEALWERLWVENAALQAGTDYETALAAHRARPDGAANRLTLVETQLEWLRALGFVDVDCYWKHFELAVFAGFKEGNHVFSRA